VLGSLPSLSRSLALSRSRCALASEHVCAGKLACKICNSQIRLLPPSRELWQSTCSGWRSRHRSCGRSAQFPRSEYRNSRGTFGFAIPTKMPTKRTAGVNFYLCFQCVGKFFPRNPESSQWFKLLLSLEFFPWCPWPESNQHSLRNSILSRARLPVPPQGPSVAGRRAGAAKRAEYSGRRFRVNPRGCDCGLPRQAGGGGIGRCCLFEHGLCSGERP
jgi:hypothetical protein